MKSRRAGAEAVRYKVRASHKPNIGHLLIYGEGGTAQLNR